MEKGNENQALSGFDELFSALSDPSELAGGVPGVKVHTDDEDLSDDELEALKNGSKGRSPSVSEVFGGKAGKQKKAPVVEEPVDEEDEEDEEEEPVVKKPRAKREKPAKRQPKIEEPVEEPEEIEEPEEDEDGEDNEAEGNAVGLFFDAVAEELGIELDEDDEKPTTVEDLVGYFKKEIEDRSTPTYANEEIKELDEFVRNGGNLVDYIRITADLDLDNFDLKSESNQELIVREFLAEKGFSNTQINKKLSKYRDADLLEDEAEDALEALKEIKAEQKEELLTQQKEQHQRQIEQQRKFVSDVYESVKTFDNVRGVPVSKKDREQLFAYVTKTDSKGLTQYQKDFYKNGIQNLLESALFTMKGDIILQTAAKTGKTSAIKALKDSLSSSVPSKGSRRVSTRSGLDSFSGAVQQMFVKN